MYSTIFVLSSIEMHGRKEGARKGGWVSVGLGGGDAGRWGGLHWGGCGGGGGVGGGGTSAQLLN